MLTPGKALRSIADLSMPRTCVVCGRELLLDEDTICLCCLEDIPYTYHWMADHNPMADKFNAHISKMDGSIGKERYCSALALMFYRKDSEFRRIPQSLKYHSNFKSGKYFSHMLAEKLAAAEWMNGFDLVVPVPLHWTRKWKRGFNQAEFISERIAECFPGANVKSILRRSRRTRTQTIIGYRRKEDNVKGAFVCRKRLPAASHILLVDDVYTSGSTLFECYRALRQRYGYDVRISVATLAFSVE